MTIVEEFREDPLRVLDRLVDDELSQGDRRTLLATLDDEPGAWRACALAFVEHQSWQRQLPAAALELATSTIHQTGTSNQTGTSTRGASRPSWWGMCLAAAAALLLSFGLGTQFSPRSASVEIAAQPSTSESAKTPSPDPDRRIPSPSEAAPRQVAETAEEQPWTTLTLASADPAHPDKQIQVRVLAESQTENPTESTNNWANESDVPSELLTQLEAAGWQVERKQRLLPVDLSDGRRMVVPIEELDLSYPQWIRY